MTSSDVFQHDNWVYIYQTLLFKATYRLYFFCQYVCSLGIEPTTFALLMQCSNHWATGTQFKLQIVQVNLHVLFLACFLCPSLGSHQSPKKNMTSLSSQSPLWHIKQTLVISGYLQATFYMNFLNVKFKNKCNPHATTEIVRDSSFSLVGNLWQEESTNEFPACYYIAGWYW